jgi:hypothetical protein
MARDWDHSDWYAGILEAGPSLNGTSVPVGSGPAFRRPVLLTATGHTPTRRARRQRGGTGQGRRRNKAAPTWAIGMLDIFQPDWQGFPC